MQQHDYVGANAPPTAVARSRFSFRRLLEPVASLRLTVILFVLTLILVFFGTLAQKRDSLNTVLADYFYCWLAWLDLNAISDFTQVFLKGFRFAGTDEDPVRVQIPFPGGFLIGTLMAINLTAAHVVRFKLTWRRLGIWLLHAGVIVLLAGEFVRANWAVEDRMTLREGQTGTYLFSLDRTELAFLKPTGSEADDVVSVPGELIERAGAGGMVTHPDAPFDIEVVQYIRNSKDPNAPPDHSGIEPVGFGEANPATAGIGRAIKLREHKEFSSIKGEGQINMAACYLTLKDKSTGQPVGTYLFGTEIEEPQPVGDSGWRAAFRLKRTYLPYTVTAVSVERENWPGTMKPKEFKSVVRVDHPAFQESREALIEMNRPLRYEGRTFYQSTMNVGGPAKVTGFQVVQNPGSHIPYAACTLITLGMAAHFLLKLVEFLKRRARR